LEISGSSQRTTKNPHKEEKYHGVVSHADIKTAKRKFHIVELGNNKYKLQVKKCRIWFYVREGFKVKIFEDFSNVVNYLNRLKK
jgi:hypothetical protein